MRGNLRAVDGRPLRVLAGHQGAVTGVAFSPGGALLATAPADGTARIWNAATGEPLATLIPLPGAATRF